MAVSQSLEVAERRRSVLLVGGERDGRPGQQTRRLAPEHGHAPADLQERGLRGGDANDLLRLDPVGHRALGVGATAPQARANTRAVRSGDEGDLPGRWKRRAGEDGGTQIKARNEVGEVKPNSSAAGKSMQH